VFRRSWTKWKGSLGPAEDGESKGNGEGKTEASGVFVTVPVTHAVTTAGRLPPASSEEGEHCGASVWLREGVEE
jgi:hypothetical protein